MTAASYLHNRWNKELKYWRLRWWQFALLLLWSAWSLICGWLFPAHPELWLFPQAPFLAFGYLGGGSVYVHLSGAIMGLSTRPMLHGFLLTYLALVSWRWHRDGKRPNPSLQGDASPQSGSRPELRR